MTTPAAKFSFEPRHDFFVAIDSDGCVFDSMALKQKECFIPTSIRIWGLQSVARQARETAEFINLYSIHRGSNRWTALVLLFRMLEKRADVRAIMPQLPDYRPLVEFVESGRPLSNASIEAAAAETGDPILRKAVTWTREVNAAVAAMVDHLPPLPHAPAAIETLAGRADLIVVSQTPQGVIDKEWRDFDIDRFVRLMGGQEWGTKIWMIQQASAGHYRPDHMLMIGDALGDLEAARACGMLFYPILPADEDASWKRLLDEGLARFFEGNYRGEYEAARIRELLERLPEQPPWKA